MQGINAGTFQPRNPHSRSAPQGLATASVQTFQGPQFLHPDRRGSLGTAGLDTHLWFHLGQIIPAKRSELGEK